MTQRMEAIIYDLVMDTDDIEDRLLDSGSVPSAQTMHQLRRRIFRIRRQLSSVRQVISPIATDPARPLDADDRETLVRCSNHVTRYMESLEDCRARAQMLQDHIGAIDAESGHQHAAGGRQTSSRFGLSGLLGMLFRLCHNRR
jgi:Mg2+ and Co2+ transporter CorA